MINLRLLIGKPLKTGSFTERILGANIFSFFTVDTLSSWKHVVSEEEQMRPDIISDYYYNNPNYLDVLCKYNGISNPFSIYAGQILIVPKNPANFFKNALSIIDKGSIKAIPNIVPASTADRSRLNYLTQKASSKVAPNVTLPKDQNIRIKDGNIIFGADVTNVNKADCPTPISRSKVLKTLIEAKIFNQ
jgi:hypothetical protein